MSSQREPEPDVLALIKEDYDAHGRDWTRPGFQAMALYRFGVWRMKIEPRALRMPLSALYNTAFVAVRNLYGIEVPYTARIGRRVVLEHQHGIVVHGSSVVGDDCILRQGVTLGIRRMDRLDDAPVLGKGVNVGAGAKILGNVQIGDEVAIGANAVVVHDVPAGGVVVGPAGQLLERPSAVPPPPTRLQPRENGGR